MPARLPKAEWTRQVIEPLVARFAEQAHLPGIAWGVADRAGLLVAGATGLASLAPRVPAEPQLVWRIASMTKSVTACCVLMLRDEGRLSLDDPVARYLPEFATSAPLTEDSPAVTLRHLLTMSAGLVEDDPWADRQLDMGAAAFGALLAAGVAFDTVPGVRYQYSNLGYALLGQVVRVVAGQPLAHFARERLFTPLGMSRTTFAVDGVAGSERADGYHDEGGERGAVPMLADGVFGAMGGLGTTIPDFARYMAFHLDAWPARDGPDAAPLRRATRREMAQPWRPGPTWPAQPELVLEGYGFGWVVGRHPRYGQVVGHSGGLPGFGSHVELLLDRGVGVVAFANRTYAPMRGLVGELVDQLLAEGGPFAVGEPLLAGGPGPRSSLAALPGSPAPLLAAQVWLSGLYERWDPERAAELAAENLFRDVSEGARAGALAALRGRFGPVVSVGPLRREGALRGSWRLVCERGELDAWVWLAPVPSGVVQAYGLEPVTGGRAGESPSPPPAGGSCSAPDRQDGRGGPPGC